MDYSENKYSTYSELINSDHKTAFTWFPGFLPDTAYNLKESHRVDVACIKGEFYLDENNGRFVDELCSDIILENGQKEMNKTIVRNKISSEILEEYLEYDGKNIERQCYVCKDEKMDVYLYIRSMKDKVKVNFWGCR